MIIPMQKMPPIPIFCLREIRNPIKRRIGKSMMRISLTISTVVAIYIALVACELGQVSCQRQPKNFYPGGTSLPFGSKENRRLRGMQSMKLDMTDISHVNMQTTTTAHHHFMYPFTPMNNLR